MVGWYDYGTCWVWAEAARPAVPPPAPYYRTSRRVLRCPARASGRARRSGRRTEGTSWRRREMRETRAEGSGRWRVSLLKRYVSWCRESPWALLATFCGTCAEKNTRTIVFNLSPSYSENYAWKIIQMQSLTLLPLPLLLRLLPLQLIHEIVLKWTNGWNGEGILLVSGL